MYRMTFHTLARAYECACAINRTLDIVCHI